VIALQAQGFPGAHSALEPSGPAAHLIDRVWDFSLVVSSAVWVLVVAALLWATFRRRPADAVAAADEAARERGMRNAVLGASALTVVTLFIYLGLDLATARPLTATPGRKAVQIRVTGHQWWWDVEYRDARPDHWAYTANEIHVPAGRPVVLELRSTDVIHSLWIPNLGLKRDLIPGHVNTVWFQADTPGVYRAQCAEFCGHQHAKMALLIVADPPERFGGWLARQRDSARTPTDSLALRGQEVFLAGSCGMCHTIQGTPAGSRIGPNLTHLAGRRTIAAGTLPNTRGNLAGWIVDPQGIKPGARMPSNQLSPADLHALLVYLESLE
jgi:cytochrome c oxidase subunit 2